MIGDFFRTEQGKRILVIASGIFILLCIVLSFIPHGPKVTKVPKVNEKVPVQTPAVIINGSGLYKSLNNDTAYINLRADLAQFGRSYFKITAEPLNFKITSQSGLTFDGEFEAKKVGMHFVLGKLANDRLRITATIRKGSKDVSNNFTSNSGTNKFIATLPVTKDSYDISYVADDQSITVNLYDRAPALLMDAEEYLRKQTGMNELKNLKLNYIYPSEIDDTSSSTFDGE